MAIFEATKGFPREETYSLTDQIRRSSRSVSGEIAEGWRRRKYEAAETQTWLEYSVRCGYLAAKQGRELHRLYDRVMGKLTIMGNRPDQWCLKRKDA